MTVTFAVFQSAMLLLNDDADAKRESMSVTWAVSHFERSPLNAEAPLKVPNMFPTFEVFQSAMFWLKEDASLNKYSMEVAPEVSHPEMSSLKSVSPSKMYDKFCTAETSQSFMMLDDGFAR